MSRLTHKTWHVPLCPLVKNCPNPYFFIGGERSRVFAALHVGSAKDATMPFTQQAFTFRCASSPP